MTIKKFTNNPTAFQQIKTKKEFINLTKKFDNQWKGIKKTEKELD